MADEVADDSDSQSPRHIQSSASQAITDSAEVNSTPQVSSASSVEENESGNYPSEAGLPHESEPPQESAQEEKKERRKNRRAPDFPLVQRRNWLIHLHYSKREYDICRKLIDIQLTESCGMCEYAYYVNGLIAREEGEIQESLDLFEMARNLNPSNVDNLKQVARSLFLLGHHRAALEAYNKASLLSPRDWEIYHNQGTCYMYIRDIDKAIENLKMALQLSKHDISFSMLGKCFLIQGQIDTATDVYKKAVEFSPENPELMTTLGLLYLQAGLQQKAFEQLGNALTFDSANAKAILAAGAMIQRHGDYDVALTKYRVAAHATPESPQLWNNIGMCFFGKKKFVASISCLKRAVYLAPFEWKILFNLGLVHLTMRQYASAFHFLSAAVTLNHAHAQLFMLLAVALTNLGDVENAIQSYERAIALNRDDPLTYLNYAIMSYGQGDKRSAAKHLSSYARVVQAVPRDSIDAEVTATSVRLEAVLHVGVSYSSPLDAPQKNTGGLDCAEADSEV